MKNDYFTLKTDYIIYGILLIVVAGLGYTIWDFSSSYRDKSISGNDAIEINSGKYSTESSGDTENGNVQIDLTPKGVANGKFEVGIAANTHSVSLDGFDLKQITVLQYNGKDYRPSSAPSLSAHHGSGTLVFDLSSEPDNFKIIIIGIPSVQERIFEWKK